MILSISSLKGCDVFFADQLQKSSFDLIFEPEKKYSIVFGNLYQVRFRNFLPVYFIVFVLKHYLQSQSKGLIILPKEDINPLFIMANLKSVETPYFYDGALIFEDLNAVPEFSILFCNTSQKIRKQTLSLVNKKNLIVFILNRHKTKDSYLYKASFKVVVNHYYDSTGRISSSLRIGIKDKTLGYIKGRVNLSEYSPCGNSLEVELRTLNASLRCT
ncbi:MAG: hypothetical protein NZT61_00570 [Deltaproteobacteria bacterium]|nr:hypothetical protein [Deltaproteobacteria bacterium]MCX7952023.1 hypothetical protein [Deltaproteobacteria bacterium]